MADDTTLPTEDEIRQLPRWARVAFAARCARRALPLFQKHWPDAPEEHVTAVRRAVEVAEHSAADAHGAADASKIAAAAIRVSAIATRVNATAAAAARSARMTSRTRTGSIARSVSTAAAACGASAIPLMRTDFERVLAQSRRQRWNNKTPVPPTVFDPLEEQAATPEPGGVPQPLRLKLRAIAERGTSADTVRKHLVAVYKALNEHFLEKYGTFLTRDQFKRLVFEETRVRV
jgi:hypothetical protein